MPAHHPGDHRARPASEVCVGATDDGLRISVHGEVDEVTSQVLQVIVTTAMGATDGAILLDVSDADQRRVRWLRTMLRLATVAPSRGRTLRVLGAPVGSAHFVRRHRLQDQLELIAPPAGSRAGGRDACAQDAELRRQSSPGTASGNPSPGTAPGGLGAVHP